MPDADPAINAQMPIPSFFVAQALNPEGKPIYRITDTNTLGGISDRTISIVLLLIIMVALVFTILSSNRNLYQEILLKV